MEKDLAAVERETPGGHHRLAPLPRADPLSDPVDEQISDAVFAEIARLEGLVVLPQLLAHLRHRRLRKQKPARLVLESVLDVAHRQAPSQHLHRQRLKRLGMASEMVAQRRAERLLEAGHLRRRIFQRPFGRLQALRPVAVAMAPTRLSAVLVVAAIERVPHLTLQRLFHDQPGRRLHQLRTTRRRSQPSFDQSRKSFTGMHRCRYPLGHGVLLELGPAPPSPLSNPPKGCTPTQIPSNSKTSPAARPYDSGRSRSLCRRAAWPGAFGVVPRTGGWA